MGFLDASGITDLVNKLKTKFQEKLVSGTNIKTVNNTSLLGNGNVSVQPTLVSGTNIKTVNNKSLLGSGDVEVQPILVSGANIKTVNNESLLGSGNITIEGGGGGTTTTWYGTSSTDASVSAKTVICSGFTLATGAIISVLFSTANTANTPTLNVNSTGDKTIYIGASTPDATNSLKWSANTMLTFIYDGTYFRYISARSANSVDPAEGGGVWYGGCNTTASTVAKTASIANFRLVKGAIVVLYCTAANTAEDALTLNINSTGSKSIYYNGSATSSSNILLWDVGEYLTFLYNGSNYTLIAKTHIPVASTTQLGTVMIDGESIVIKNNKISTPGQVSVMPETITIAPSEWSNGTCTKSITSLMDNSTVFVTYAPESAADYLAANIYCSAQGADTLTFSCTTTPSVSVKINVLVVNKPITLEGTTWYFNATIAEDTFDAYNINFTTGSYSCKNIIGTIIRSKFQLRYTRINGTNLTAYYHGTGWAETDYRTITITDGEDVRNTDLIAWLQANATQVS